MKSTSYEFKHPSGGKSAYISHDQYDSDNSEEYMSHVPGEKSLIHSTWNKAQKRLAMHGYEKHEDHIEESVAGKSFKFFRATLNEMTLSENSGAVQHLITKPSTSFSHALAAKHEMHPDDIHATQSRALFDLTYNAKSPFKDISTAKAFLNSPHGAKLSDSHKNVIAHPEFRDLVKKFGVEPPSHMVESASDVNEAAAPGMEEWIRSNKKEFTDQYGEKKGTSILYATAWKLYDNKVNEATKEQEWTVIPQSKATDPKSGHPMFGIIKHNKTGTKIEYSIDDSGKARSGAARSGSLEQLMAYHSKRINKDSGLNESALWDLVNSNSVDDHKAALHHPDLEDDSDAQIELANKAGHNADLAHAVIKSTAIPDGTKARLIHHDDDSVKLAYLKYKNLTESSVLDPHRKLTRFEVSADIHGSNQEVPLYRSKKVIYGKDDQEVIGTFKELFGGRNHDAKKLDEAEGTDGICLGAKCHIKDNIGTEPLTVSKIHDDQQVEVQDEYGQKKKVMIADLVAHHVNEDRPTQKKLPRKGTLAYEIMMDRKKQDQSPEHQKFIDSLGNDNHHYGNAKVHHIDEMVMDAIQHPTLGRVEWRNEGGKHMITMDNKKTRGDNVVNINTMGPHKEFAAGSHEEIAKKWAFVKNRLLKEDADWVEVGGMNQLIESVVESYFPNTMAVGDVISVHQHVSGKDMGKYGEFNISAITPTQIHAIDHNDGNKVMRFNKYTERGIGQHAHLRIGTEFGGQLADASK